jgi:ammonium transporter, Amt family
MRFPARLLPLLLLLVAPGAAAAQDPSAAEVLFTVNNLWLLVATFLVFLMHLGFTALESGLTQSKNTVNILFKNMSIIAIGILTYAVIGFSLMYPDDFAVAGILGWAGIGVGTDAEGLTAAYDPGFTYWADFIFQAMFAATAATIVSGAVAERIRLDAFLLFSAIYVALVYPVLGSWQWGGGWLDELGFYDFAGSTVVHSVGGWAALAGVMLLGPRVGKYVNGSIRPILGHNLPLAVMGMFLLWLGWFGFNGGSVLSADPGEVSFVFVTTALAAAAGVVGAMATTWTIHKHPDVTMVLNGALAGLVGITAGADVVSVLSSVIIGFLAGILVVLSVMMLDRRRLDDPVGAISVHLTCGIWGTLAVGIFSPEFSVVTQLIGVVGYGIPAFGAALLLFGLLKATMGIRVSEDDERRGLDLSEHNMEAYSEFQVFNPRS